MQRTVKPSKNISCTRNYVAKYARMFNKAHVEDSDKTYNRKKFKKNLLKDMT